MRSIVVGVLLLVMVPGIVQGAGATEPTKTLFLVDAEGGRDDPEGATPLILSAEEEYVSPSVSMEVFERPGATSRNTQVWEIRGKGTEAVQSTWSAATSMIATWNYVTEFDNTDTNRGFLTTEVLFDGEICKATRSDLFGVQGIVDHDSHIRSISDCFNAAQVPDEIPMGNVSMRITLHMEPASATQVFGWERSITVWIPSNGTNRLTFLGPATPVATASQEPVTMLPTETAATKTQADTAAFETSDVQGPPWGPILAALALGAASVFLVMTSRRRKPN